MAAKWALSTPPSIDTNLRCEILAAGIERPRTYTDAAPPGEPQSTFVTEPHLTRIRNACAAAERPSLTPHTAFRDPTAPANVRPRESIEVRTLVFHPA